MGTSSEMMLNVKKKKKKKKKKRKKEGKEIKVSLIIFIIIIIKNFREDKLIWDLKQCQDFLLMFIWKDIYHYVVPPIGLVVPLKIRVGISMISLVKKKKEKEKKSIKTLNFKYKIIFQKLF